MNDAIVNDLYEIRNYLDQVTDYVKKIKDPKDIFSVCFVQTRQHLYDIYNDRLDSSIHLSDSYEGHRNVVQQMEKSNLENIRLTYIDGQKKSCSVFSSEDYSIILGMIFYDN